MKFTCGLITFFFFNPIITVVNCQSIPPNFMDSIGLRQGEWIEIDTIKIYNNTSQTVSYSMKINGCVKSTKYEPPFIEYYVCKSQGEYLNGSKSGVWKYFKDERLIKQVTFTDGIIDKVEIYDGKQKLYLTATRKHASIWSHYIMHDGSGKEGDVPTILLYSNSVEFLH